MSLCSAQEEKDDSPESPSIGPKPKLRTPPKDESFDSDEEEDNMSSKAIKAFDKVPELKHDGSNWSMWSTRVERATRSVGYKKYLENEPEKDNDKEADADADLDSCWS